MTKMVKKLAALNCRHPRKEPIMKRKTLSMLLASAGVAILVFASTVFAIDTENQKQEDLSSYSVRVNGKRKNHCTTIGLKEPESVTCPSCGTQTTDITRSYTLPDGFEEVACDSYQYGTDILYHYVDCYQAVCHDCPSMEDPDVLEDQTFCFEQERTLIFCEGRSHI